MDVGGPEPASGREHAIEDLTHRPAA